MRQSFTCPFCKILVLPENSHVACRKTCGSPECQAKLYSEHIKQVDQRKQRQKIQSLKQQGIDLVTCQICQEEFEMIHHGHLKTHGLTVANYREKFPDAPILNSRIRNIKAKTARGRSQYLSYKGKKADARLYEFFTATLLGDGSLEKAKGKKNARYAEGGSNKQYMQWKYDFLKDYFSCTFQERLSSPHSKTGKSHNAWWLRTKVHPVLTELHSQWYLPDKHICREMIEQYLTEFALSVWFYDDGCASSGTFLYLNDFPESDAVFISEIIQSRFKLKNSVLKNKNDQCLIRISNYSRKTLFMILDQYPITGMEYKRQKLLQMAS
ncbi:DNA endonuclease (plasmid) [Picosynechococcus sp. PCC 11901]|uniref:DNA endonuclease n=1 Tax=Picosynechococcus sp. PCC 11901 TaxID=2579791 RepID=UPI0010FC2CDA|nr:DNA endonuclease [Picosynechococcus sp. PCC 11901]QCS48115.1 DNA endonuclease [Picosynechococcus sp. PCC 11901]